MNLRDALEASVALKEWRARNMKPDLTNKQDVDVLGWLQSVELHAREFHDDYDKHRSATGYDEYAADIVADAKRLIFSIAEARERQAEIDRRG